MVRASFVNLNLRQKLLSGLAWLWKTWQDTAPGPIVSQSQVRPQQQQSLSLDDFGDFDESSKPAESSGGDWRTGQNAGDSLNYPAQGVIYFKMFKKLSSK